MEYKYGMRKRPFDIGCQPKGCVDVSDDNENYFYDIITYNRELTEKEIIKYELVDLSKGL